MTEQELKEKLKDIERDAQKAKEKVIREYCFANNPVKVGDIVQDHIGFLKVTGINAFHYWGKTQFECVYTGIELTKKLEPCKKQTNRRVYQSNLIEKDKP